MYAKLFARITESSLMEEAVPVRYTFVMLLAIADKDGDVIGTDVAISRRLNMPVPQFVACIEALSKEDPDSNSKDEGGRRVTTCAHERGYHIVNYVKYRQMTTEFQKKEYMRKYMQEYRKQGKSPSLELESVKLTESNGPPLDSSLEVPSVSESSSPKKGSAEGKKFKPPTDEELKLELAKRGLPDSEGQKFMAYYGSNGWRVGKNPMKSWRLALQNWKLNFDERRFQGNDTSAGRPKQKSLMEKELDRLMNIKIPPELCPPE